MIAITQRIHRVPETAMAKGAQFVVARNAFERTGLPARHIALDAIHDRSVEHEKAAVDVALIPRRLFDKAQNAIVLQIDGAVATRRNDGRQGGEFAVSLMKGDAGAHVEIGQSIAIGEPKILPVRYGRTRSNRPPVSVSSPVSTK